MKKRKVISNNNLRIRNPLWVMAILYLLFDKWDVPQWVYGAIGVLLLFWLIVFLIDWFNTTNVDIFKEDTGGASEPKEKSSFKERLERATKNLDNEKK